jgi:hypothetical protein
MSNSKLYAVKYNLLLIISIGILAYIVYARFWGANPEAADLILDVLGSLMILVIAGTLLFIRKENQHYN